MTSHPCLQLGFKSRVPVILQTEAAECGLATLAMIATYHGYRIDLAALRRRFSISLKGATLAHLIRIANEIHLAARPLRLELDELAQLKLPCILHWDLNHFVVMIESSKRGITIHDPAFGLKRFTYAEASAHFTGVALELLPNPEFVPREEIKAVRVSALMGNVSGLRRSLMHILGLSFCLQIFTMVGPFFMQFVVDHVLVTADRDLLNALVVGFVLLMLLQTSVSLLRSWVVMAMATHLNVQWVSNVFSHLLRLPIVYFERRHVGDIVSRFGSISSIQRTLSTMFVEAILDGVMAVATIAMMLVYSPPLSAIALMAVFLYGTLRLASFRPFRDATEEQIVLSAKQQSHFLETIRGIQSIKLFNHESERQSRFLNVVVDTTNRALKTQRMSLGFGAASSLVFGIQGVVVIWVGADLVLQGAISIGMLFAFVAYKDQFTARISGLIDKGVELKMLGLQAERLADIVLTEPEQYVGNERPIEISQGEFEARDIWFRYADSDPWVLQGVTFKVATGESIALVGASGSGKTTLMKLMLGILKPVRGEFLIAGARQAQLGLSNLRSLIGTVMQDDQLFAGSVADNISFFDSVPDHSRIEECARIASIHGEIISMPMGYNTLIGDMGTAVSGGQKQRILLARALYKRPRFLFLDEATSHLDVDRERLVNTGIHRLQMTRIIIAHRPETIRMADRVLVLEAGEVVSSGLIKGAARPQTVS